MTRAKDISKIVTDADLSGTLDVNDNLTVNNTASSSTTAIWSGGRLNLQDNTSYAEGVGGALTFEGKYNSSGSYSVFGYIRGSKNDATDGGFQGGIVYGSRNGDHVFVSNSSGLTDGTTKRMQIESNGDISFYEDTGTTPKLFWDASAERLAIGVSSPAATLHIGDSDDATNGTMRFGQNSTYYGYIQKVYGTDKFDIGTNGAGQHISFTNNGTERMRIDSSGNVGIGDDDPDMTTVIAYSDAGTDFNANDFTGGLGIYNTDDTNNTSSAINFKGGSRHDVVRIGAVRTSNSTSTSSNSADFVVSTRHLASSLGERLRLTSNGLLGLSTSSPAEILSINGNMRLQTGMNPARIQYFNSTGTYSVGSSGGASISFHDVSGSQEISFETHHTGSSHAERMRIDKNGSITSTAASGNMASFSSTTNAVEFKILSPTGNVVRLDTGADDVLAFAPAGTERMRILSNGKLIVNQSASYSADSKIELHSPASVPVSLYMLKAAQVEVNLGFKASTDSNFYINTGASTVGAAGKGVYLTNGGTSWNSNSDFRKKKNLVAIENGLDKIANCRAMTGHFNNEEDNVKKRPFLIAQDWLIALPEAVDENTVDDDGNENLGLSYEGTIPLLVACIKELREQNIDLKARIAALETA